MNIEGRSGGSAASGFARFMGRRAAEELVPEPNTAMISISDAPDWGKARLEEDAFTKVLRVHFVDSTYSESTIENFGPSFAVKFASFFDRERSERIREFVHDCVAQGVDGIYVHCDAGRSRSAAVAQWIGEAYGFHVEGDTSRANELVLSLLRDPSIFDACKAAHSIAHETERPPTRPGLIARVFQFFS